MTPVYTVEKMQVDYDYSTYLKKKVSKKQRQIFLMRPKSTCTCLHKIIKLESMTT